MRNVKILAAAGLMTMAGIAQADVTGTATIVTDYDFRGVSQSGGDPALQLSLDYASAGGWYIGTWGSSIDDFVDDDGLGSAQTEIDVYTGFRGATEGGLGWDVGLNYYAYPGANGLDFAEIYGKLSYSIVSGGLYFSDNYGGTSDESAYYVYGDLGIPAGPVTVGLHAGYSSGDGIEEYYFGGPGPGSDDNYQDYAVGVSYSASNLTLGIKWVTADFGDAGSDDRVILSVATALPWK